ncbi:MAG: phosphatase PAP2 family protein [Candidatus Gracilibacteria bacterium]
MLQEINKEILISLNSLTSYDFIQTFILCLADTPIFFLPIFLLCSWIYYTYKKSPVIISDIHFTKNLLEKEKLLYIFYSVLIGISISLLIQQIIQVDRPEEAIKGVGLLLLDHIPNASFPSDHATVAIAFLTSLFLAGYKKIGFFYLPFVIFMLLSRIILGVHWPFDIFAGTIVGVFSSFITFKYLNKIAFIEKLNKFIIDIMGYLKL